MVATMQCDGVTDKAPTSLHPTKLSKAAMEKWLRGTPSSMADPREKEVCDNSQIICMTSETQNQASLAQATVDSMHDILSRFFSKLDCAFAVLIVRARD
jgi:hypothetical protein